MGDAVGVGSALEEALGHREGGSAGAGIVEGPGISEDSGVEAVGHRRCDRNAGGKGEIVDHGANGGRGRIDPVEIGELATAAMVVDVDGQGGPGCVEFETIDAAALDAVALEKDDSVRSDEPGGDAFDAGKAIEVGGDRIDEDDRGPLAHGFKEMLKAERGADGIAIRTDMRADDKAVALADEVEQSGDRGLIIHGQRVSSES